MNGTMVDRKGVIYRGRENLNQWKSAHAIDTKDRNPMPLLNPRFIDSVSIEPGSIIEISPKE